MMPEPMYRIIAAGNNAAYSMSFGELILYLIMKTLCKPNY